jgi:hypothetical protein
VKYPDWLAAELDRTGTRHAAREITRTAAIGAIRDVILRDADQFFLRGIAAAFAARALNSWHQERRATGAVVPDAQCELFPDLPARLYVRPGVTKPVAEFTGRDWDMARAVLENRTSYAKKAAEADWAAFDAAYSKIRPLLSDGLTTADVLGGLDGGAAEATP